MHLPATNSNHLYVASNDFTNNVSKSKTGATKSPTKISLKLRQMQLAIIS